MLKAVGLCAVLAVLAAVLAPETVLYYFFWTNTTVLNLELDMNVPVLGAAAMIALSTLGPFSLLLTCVLLLKRVIRMLARLQPQAIRTAFIRLRQKLFVLKGRVKTARHNIKDAIKGTLLACSVPAGFWLLDEVMHLDRPDLPRATDGFFWFIAVVGGFCFIPGLFQWVVALRKIFRP